MNKFVDCLKIPLIKKSESCKHIGRRFKFASVHKKLIFMKLM